MILRAAGSLFRAIFLPRFTALHSNFCRVVSEQNLVPARWHEKA
jgi:hypothetical protein